MERLILRYKDAENSLNTLRDILNEPFSIIVRDATIQRFEYTFEAFWKFIKEYLKIKEGVVANAPKQCFREIFTLGFCNEKESFLLLEMTDRRNETSHTYKEEVAQRIYGKIKEYCVLMQEILYRFKIKT